MGGHSGSRTGRHTPLISTSSNTFAVSKAQREIVKRAFASKTGTLFIRGGEVRSAKSLEMIGAGTVTDEGSLGAPGTNTDGERWVFTLAKGVQVVQ
jgi:hypothetical protein